jgi:hypothetical protein
MPVAVEVLGPPGAGKTALRSALCARIDRVLPLPIYLSRQRIPQHLWEGLALFPMSFHQTLRTPRIAREYRLLLRLEGASRVLERASDNGARVVILDQGPVHTMMRLRATIPEPARSGWFQDWWDRKLRTWSESLDLIIVLDAPDEVLLDRIRTRPKVHHLEGDTNVGAREILATHRVLQEAMIGEVRDRKDLPLLRLNTGRRSLEDAVVETMAALARVKTGNAELSSASRSSFPQPERDE